MQQLDFSALTPKPMLSSKAASPLATILIVFAALCIMLGIVLLVTVFKVNLAFYMNIVMLLLAPAAIYFLLSFSKIAYKGQITWTQKLANFAQANNWVFTDITTNVPDELFKILAIYNSDSVKKRLKNAYLLHGTCADKDVSLYYFSISYPYRIGYTYRYFPQVIIQVDHEEPKYLFGKRMFYDYEMEKVLQAECGYVAEGTL